MEDLRERRDEGEGSAARIGRKNGYQDPDDIPPPPGPPAKKPRNKNKRNTTVAATPQIMRDHPHPGTSFGDDTRRTAKTHVGAGLLSSAPLTALLMRAVCLTDVVDRPRPDGALTTDARTPPTTRTEFVYYMLLFGGPSQQKTMAH